MDIEKEYDPEPLSVRNVRELVAKGLHDTTHSIDDVVLVASELATNAIAHARTPFKVRLTAPGDHVRLEVSDQSSVIPAIEQLSGSQRGLRIVQALSSRWGIDPDESGKTIWVDFDLPPK